MWISLCGDPRSPLPERLKLTALQLRSDGTWGHLELNGPTDIELRTMSCDFLGTALIVLDVVDLGLLQLYTKLIAGYHRRYGPTVWHIVYQVDTGMRLEQMVRLLRAAVANQERAKKEGQVTDFKTDRPWLDAINDICGGF